MLFCLAFIFLLVNAFAAESNAIELCVDKAAKDLCRRIKSRGECLMLTYVEFAKGACAKTCEWCTPEKPKNSKFSELHFYADEYSMINLISYLIRQKYNRLTVVEHA
ncbi:hypothetical protein V3C99_004861 [Haemonchus contortus]